MAIPDNTTHFIFSGSLAGGEVWATGFWVTGFTTGTAPTDASLTTATAAAPWTAVKTAILACLSSGDGATAIDAYHYVGGVAVRHAHATWSGTGTGSTPHPHQIACVIGLRTNLATRSGRGRMYFPATGVTVNTTGLFGSTQINALEDAMSLLLSLYNTSPNHTVVVSQTNTSTEPVLSLSMDNVPDTQRRRRNKLVGTVRTVTIP